MFQPARHHNFNPPNIRVPLSCISHQRPCDKIFSLILTDSSKWWSQHWRPQLIACPQPEVTLAHVCVPVSWEIWVDQMDHYTQTQRPGVTSKRGTRLMLCTLQNQKCKWMCESSSIEHGRHHPAGSHRDRQENKQLCDGFINPQCRETVCHTLTFMLQFTIRDKNLICQGMRNMLAPDDKLK